MISRALGQLRGLSLAALLSLAAQAGFAASLTAGPMLGHVTSRTANLWLQADGAAEARLEYWPELEAGGRMHSPTVRLDAATDFSTLIQLTDLRPNTRYRYAVFLDGVHALEGEYLLLRTLPAWKGNTAPPDFTVYMGSCAFLNDPRWDRPGKPYGGGEDIFTTIASAATVGRHPSMMLWLGDNLYFREADLESPWAMNARYRASRSHPALQGLLRAVPNYAVWDDHDYGPNNANRSFIFKDASRELFTRYWANPAYGLSELPGVFSVFSIGDADFFLLDDRTYRASDETMAPDNEVSWWQTIKDWAIGSNEVTRILSRRYGGSGPVWTGENKVMFGTAQMDWLKQALINSKATFKVVVSGNQLLNDANTFEGWQHFPPERGGFFEWLSRQKVNGLLFLSGDRHHTELIKRVRKDAYPLYELTCSPLTATPAIPDAEKENPQREAGTLVSQRNFCSLEITGAPEARQIQLRAHDGKGKVLWEKRIEASELRDPPPDSP
jgi:alkaline phosphatase D